MALVLRFDPKAPTDILPYTLDFSDWLGPSDTISDGATASVAPDDMTVILVSVAGAMVTAWLSGGTSGTDYVVSYTINTASGEHVTRSAKLFCISPR